MPWTEVSVMSQRLELVSLAQREGSNMRELCRRFGVSPSTGYKWLRRFSDGGAAAMVDQPRRPHHSPQRTPLQVEQVVLAVRDAHPAWGARKLRAWLLARGHEHLPSPSTITAILQRQGRTDPVEGRKHKTWQRFEHEAPNQLWQMDFKGHFPLSTGRCHPLTVLDDHSRFALGLEACPDETAKTVRQRLTTIFRCYGLPDRMVMDNGSPWGSDEDHHYTPLTVWLLRLGIAVSHGRPYHPQTQGKDERFHRTLKAEVLQGRTFVDLTQCQRTFDPWRTLYNLERPHEALGMAVPASRYQVSSRSFPETLPPVEYGPDDLVRRAGDRGRISVFGRNFKVGRAFKGLPVALRPTADDGTFNVLFMTYNIAQINLSQGAKRT